MFKTRFRELPFLAQKQISLSHSFLLLRNALHGSFLNSVHFDLFYCTLSLTFNVAICHRGHYGLFLVTLQRDPSIPLGEASIGPLFSWKPSNHLPPWASGAACHRSLEKHSPCIHLPSIRGWMSTNSPVRVIARLENRRLLFNAHFGFVNNWIFMTMVLSLVSKDHLCPAAPLLLNLGSTFRHITLAGFIKTRMLPLQDVHHHILTVWWVSQLSSTISEFTGNRRMWQTAKSISSPSDTLLLCLLFLCPCWPSMNSEVGFASRGLDTLGWL